MIFRTVYEESPIGIELYDSKGSLIHVNRACMAIFGLDDISQVKGFNLFDDPNVPEEKKEKLKNGQPVRFEVLFDFEKVKKLGLYKTTREGTRLLSVVATPLKERERITGYLVQVLDETVRKRAESELEKSNELLMAEIEARINAEHALRKSEEKFRTIANYTYDLEIWHGVDGRPLWMNPAVERLTGFPLSKCMEMHRFPEPLLPGDDRETFCRMFRRSLKEVSPRSHIQFRLVRKDGSSRWFSGSWMPIFNDAGEYTGLRSSFRDIQEQREAEEALERQRVVLMRTDRLRSLGEMAAGMAHEINQPLSGIRALAEHLHIGLEKGWDFSREEILEKLGMIQEQADRITHVIEHVRMFARKSGGHERILLDVNEVIQSSIGMLKEQFSANGLSLELESANGLSPVLANPFSLEEVVMNLLLNARDASEEKLNQNPLADGRILIRTLQCPEDDTCPVEIQVVDHGSGIPQDILPRVFDPFFTTKGPDRGTGLGLSICRSIVEEMGGRVALQSEPGAGTVVTVCLPAAKREKRIVNSES